MNCAPSNQAHELRQLFIIRIVRINFSLFHLHSNMTIMWHAKKAPYFGIKMSYMDMEFKKKNRLEKASPLMQSCKGEQFQRLIPETALYTACSWSHLRVETWQCLKKKKKAQNRLSVPIYSILHKGCLYRDKMIITEAGGQLTSVRRPEPDLEVNVYTNVQKLLNCWLLISDNNQIIITYLVAGHNHHALE